MSLTLQAIDFGIGIAPYSDVSGLRLLDQQNQTCAGGSTMKRTLLAVAAAVAMLMCVQSLRANTVISTINGYYDVDGYDTPSLHISNTTLANLGTAYDFTNVTLTLTGYQGANTGVVQSTSISDIASGATGVEIWGGGLGSGTGLFAYDYDDSISGGPCLNPDPAGNPMGPSNGVAGTSDGLCGQPGNFYVTFQATLSGTGIYNGATIFSQFSPNTNASGGFVGWEGLDQLGYSETVFDSHSNGGPNGVLANIYIGTPPPISTPEPATVTLSLLGAGLFTLLGVGRKCFG
jgi:hypothetical protein